MKEKALVSTITLAASLVAYFYAKNVNKDSVPYVMIGGFVGAIIGEAITENIYKRKDNGN